MGMTTLAEKEIGERQLLGVQQLRETQLRRQRQRQRLRIGDTTIASASILERVPLSVELPRLLGELEPGETVISIPRNGIVSVASAGDLERALNLIDVGEKTYHIAHQYYVDVAAKLRRVAAIDKELEAMQRSRMFVSGASRGLAELLEYKRRLQETAWHEVQLAYDLYERHAGPIVHGLIEQHQAQAFQVRRRTQTLTLVDPDALAELLREYDCDLGRMEADGYGEAGFLRIGWLLRRIGQQGGALPPTVLVKISASYGKTYLQLVYDSFHKAGCAGFEDPVSFVLLETVDRSGKDRGFDARPRG
jgi:hypothetical protein